MNIRWYSTPYAREGAIFNAEDGHWYSLQFSESPSPKSWEWSDVPVVTVADEEL